MAKAIKFAPIKLPDGWQDMNETGTVDGILDIGNLVRGADQFRVKAVGTDTRFPYALLAGGSLGFSMRVRFVNGRAWSEAERVSFLNKMEEAFRLESQEPTVNYSFAFIVTRRPLSAESLAEKKSPATPLSNSRIDFLADLSDRLEIQESEMYLSIVASPSKLLKTHRLSLLQRIKMMFSEEERLKYDSVLMEDVIVQFGDRLRLLLGKLARAGVAVECPGTAEELLLMMRDGWRPEYFDSSSLWSTEPSGDRKTSLMAEHYLGAAEFLQRELNVTQKKRHWIADGSLHMLFSMSEAPNPSRPFMAEDVDKVLALGLQPGISMIPYTGRYIVAWSSIPRVDADKIFSFKVALAKSQVPKHGGMFDDKIARKTANDLDSMHNEFIAGENEMTNASVLYHLTIPLQHLGKFFQTNLNDDDLIRTIEMNVISQLSELGDSQWTSEDKTWYLPWISTIPGAIDVSQESYVLPAMKMNLAGSLHLVPFFATIGPESPRDKNAWRGSNYFITDDANILIFDHFSQNNGTAANFSICGATGSGKSVLCQTLTMMTEPLDPYIMILDFGGGNVGSWTKLCSVMGGVELKFGSARPPRINPLQIAEADSFPNGRKKKLIASSIGLDHTNDEHIAMIDSVYLWLRMDDAPSLSKELRKSELVKRCPTLESIPHDDILEMLRLEPGYCRPGDKGAAGIRLVIELVLATNVTENGPEDNVWALFNQDDMNEAITRLYEDYLPPKGKEQLWPTLTTLNEMLEKIQRERMSGESRYGSGSILNYGLLMNRLQNYCQGGLDPFLDGQTNVDIRKKIVTDGVERETAAKFLLADMAGIADPRKLAIYMIVVNDFMSGILYNSKESRGVMIRDEAWFFMKSKIASKYLEADYRLARKYGFSVITIAQQYSDFKNPVLQNNTQTWCVCNLTSKDEIELAQERFKFNAAERDMFDSGLMGTRKEKDVTTGKTMEVYSRVLIANKAGKFFVKNKVSKRELWITTTDANETFVFNFYKDIKMRGQDPIAIIDWLCLGHYISDPELAAALKKAGRVMPSI
jgi:hypothetical protein